MATATLDYSIDIGDKPSPQARPDLVYKGSAAGIPLILFPTTGVAIVLAHPILVSWHTKISVQTVAITYGDTPPEFRQPELCPAGWTLAYRHGKPISMDEARQIALRTSLETERRRHEERAAESRFLSSLWEDEESNAS